MPVRDRHYDPQVGDSRQMEIRGFPVTIGGTYVLLDDVVTALRAYATAHESWDVNDAASWLQAGGQPLPDAPEATAEVGEPEPPDAGQDLVDRVEVYPDDPENPRPRWIARTCDATGKILTVTNGSFDQEYVLRNAGDRWPGKPVFLVADYSHDTVWEENDPGGIRSPLSSRRRPSPNRLWP